MAHPGKLCGQLFKPDAGSSSGKVMRKHEDARQIGGGHTLSKNVWIEVPTGRGFTIRASWSA